jgi:rhombotail lipoprotein
MPHHAQHLARILLLAPLLAWLAGCASTGAPCLFDCGERQRGSTPLVEYLYPDGAVPRDVETPVLRLPLRVGLSFLPDRRAGDTEAWQREAILQGVRERFRTLPYVREIVIVPDHYLTPRGGFDTLQQVARLQDLDVIALVSMDQVSHRSENTRAMLYLTVVGAFLARGSENETHTLLDLAVVDPRSRSLVLRAGGTSSVARSTTAIDQDRKLRNDATRGLDAAATMLTANLGTELVRFEERVRAGDAPVRVSRSSSSDAQGGGGGRTDPGLLLGLGLLAAVATWRRRLPR